MTKNSEIDRPRQVSLFRDKDTSPRTGRDRLGKLAVLLSLVGNVGLLNEQFEFFPLLSLAAGLHRQQMCGYVGQRPESSDSPDDARLGEGRQLLLFVPSVIDAEAQGAPAQVL